MNIMKSRDKIMSNFKWQLYIDKNKMHSTKKLPHLRKQYYFFAVKRLFDLDHSWRCLIAVSDLQLSTMLIKMNGL